MHTPKASNSQGQRNPANQKFNCLGCGALVVNKLVGTRMLPYNLDERPHSCMTKNVRVFTPEEIAKLNMNLMSGPI